MIRETIIYIISARSAHSNDPGRKISSIIEYWKKKYNVITFFGGDVLSSITSKDTSFGNANIHEKGYRKSKILSPLVHSVSEIRDIIHNIKSFNFLKNRYKNVKLVLIWERSSRLHFAGLLFAKKYKLPYILEWKDHLVDYQFSLLKPVALYFERYKCKKADKIVVESKVLKDCLTTQGINPAKIVVAYNAADSSVFIRDENSGNVYRKNLSIDSDVILIGYLGSYAFYHDTERMILAASIIKDRGYTDKVKFIMLGNGKEYLKSFSTAKQLGLLDNILLMKPAVPKEKVSSILSAIDISILPGSTDIISPIKVLEYMACETAVIVPDYSCNREVIKDQINGLLFKPENEIDLADKIEFLLKNPVLIKKLGRNAKKTVIEQFSWGNTWGKALDEITNELTKKGK